MTKSLWNCQGYHTASVCKKKALKVNVFTANNHSRSQIEPIVIKDIVNKSEDEVSLVEGEFGIKNRVCHHRASESKKWGNYLRYLFISGCPHILTKK